MQKLRLFVHRCIGHILCRICWLFWDLRDIMFPPKEKAVLFVTHSDDDTLFFHTFIEGNKPYVVVMTAGHSVNRLTCFLKNMKNTEFAAGRMIREQMIQGNISSAEESAMF